jgi:hypothetical protein
MEPSRSEDSSPTTRDTGQFTVLEASANAILAVEPGGRLLPPALP